MNILMTFIWWFSIVPISIQDIPEYNYYNLSWRKFERLPEVSKPIFLLKPNNELLDAAIFQVTNKVREKENKPSLQYSPILQRTAVFHAQAMIDLDFYDHYNYKQTNYLTPHKRITAFGGVFNYTAENIAQYDIINTDLEYCPSRQTNGVFVYLNCNTKKPYRAYTYLGYAEAVVDGWLHSPSHRKSLLSTDYQYVGCAARISKNPYQQKQVPFARMAQNFGGFGTTVDSTAKAVN